MLMLCRFTSLVFIYMYHDWFALFLLVWLTHSLMINSVLKFRVITFKFYLPLIVLMSQFIYIMNTYGAFKDNFYVGKSEFCIFKLQYPVLEMGFMMINNFCFFAWIKSCEGIREHEDNIPNIGITLMENLS